MKNGFSGNKSDKSDQSWTGKADSKKVLLKLLLKILFGKQTSFRHPKRKKMRLLFNDNKKGALNNCQGLQT